MIKELKSLGKFENSPKVGEGFGLGGGGGGSGWIGMKNRSFCKNLFFFWGGGVGFGGSGWGVRVDVKREVKFL